MVTVLLSAREEISSGFGSYEKSSCGVDAHAEGDWNVVIRERGGPLNDKVNR